MSWARRAKHLYKFFLHRGRAERELDAEIQSYFDIMVDRRMQQGLTREQAERATRLELDRPEQVKEMVREVWTGAAIDATLRDLRYALRGLRTNPGFAAVAILSLGLGLGANTAIFTVLNTVILKSLPVKDGDRLFFIDNSGGKSGGGNGPPYPCYERLRDSNHHFSGMSVFAAGRLKVTIDGVQEQVNGQFASGSYFDVLGVGAAAGRVLTPADDSIVGRGGPDGALAVISYGLWERRFGRNPAVLGKTIQVGANRVVIVGITPRNFAGLSVGSPVDITIPMMLTENNLRSKAYWWFSVVGRLKDDASQEQARAELDGYFQNYLQEVGVKKGPYFSGIALVPAAKGLEGLRRKFSQPLLIIMTIAAMLLLIGCANVANLLLARASARRKEMALRLAIGASPARLIRQCLTEGLLLVTLAAAAGVGFAQWGVSALVALFAGIRGRIVLEPHYDIQVVAFTAGVALLTGLLFSIAPALHAARTDAAKPGGDARSNTGAFRFATGNGLVVMQIMLSLVLLCEAVLFLRSLRNLTHLDAGFQRQGVLTMQVDATLPKMDRETGKVAQEEHTRLGRMWEALLEPLRTLPQVRAVSVSTLSPMSGNNRGVHMDVAGQPRRPDRERGISINQVSAGYFDAFGITQLSGRLFAPGDQANSPRVAIMNESAARTAFRGVNPIGLRVNFPAQRITDEFEVVGVVRDTRYDSLRKAATPMVYIPIQQAIDYIPGVVLAIRGSGDARGLLPMVHRQMRAVVPGGFISSVSTVQEQVDESLLEERLISILASLFGGLALLLASIGLHGIIAFTVIQRTREIGIRMAMGAPRGSVLWLVLRKTLWLAGMGLGLGVPLVFVVRKYIENELYGVDGRDPVALGSAILLLMGVALAAGAWPAWRACRLDPTFTLRQE